MAQWSHSGLKDFETWRPIRGYKGFYEVSDKGNVRRCAGSVTMQTRWGHTTARSVAARTLKPGIDARGYRSVRLSKAGVVKSFRIARLVLQAFVGGAQGREAGHRNDVPGDDRLVNLLWQTRVQNEQQKTAHGRRPLSTRGKITPALAANIRAMREKGATLKAVAEKFNTHFSNVSLICRNKTWSKV